MAANLDRPITWASVARIALAFAAEYGLLGLIEDAPFVVKVATVIFSVGALATLESREWLDRIRARLFATTMIVLGAIYLSFLIYAATYAIDRITTRQGLERIYVDSGRFYRRQLPLMPNSGACTNEGIQQFATDLAEWETNSANWITEHMGETARDRFLDSSDSMSLTFTGCGGVPAFSDVMSRLRRDRKNLATIIESKAYYGD